MQRARSLPSGRLVVAARLRSAAAFPLPMTHHARSDSCCCRLPQPSTSLWGGMTALHSTYRFASSSSSSSAAAPNAAQRNFYRVLGVDTDATPQEVKAAYRQLALRYHPDVAEDEHRAQSEVLFRRVSEAYEVLSDPVRRRAHDGELGVQTRRKQSTKSAPDSAAAATAKARTDATAGKGTASASSPFSTTRRKRKAPAQSASASQQQQQTQSSSRRYRKPFVRGDANRVFADAFDGKTLDEILFDVQRRRRQQHTSQQQQKSSSAASNTATEAAASASSTPSSALEDRALDRDARLRHVMEDAAESFAYKAQRQFGHGILRHIRAAASPLPDGPAPPPESQMPFRPFVGMTVPAGVQAPPEPQLGPVLASQDATMEEVNNKGSAEAPWRHDGAVPGQFHTHQYEDGATHSRMESLRKATKNVEGMPHNMGQLYSYHRPY